MKLYLFLILFLFLFSCGDDDSQAGIISETTNGATVSGTLEDSLGTPIIDQKIFLRSAHYALSNKNSQEYQTYTTSQGVYHFNDIPPGRYVIEAAPNKEESFASYCIISEEDSSITISESKTGKTTTLSGVISNPTAIEVEILGFPQKRTIGGDGQFHFENVPNKELLLHFSGNSIGQTLPSSLLNLDEKLAVDTTVSTIIENFDDGDNKHLLHAYRSMGWWYSHHHTSTTATPADLKDNFAASLTEKGAWKGKSCSISFDVDENADYTVPFIGIELGNGATGYPPETRWHDFSTMKELTFMAKGSGTLTVAFISRLVREDYSGASHFESRVPLTNEWRKISIPAESIAPPSGSAAERDGVTWKDGYKEIAEITFFSMDDLTLSIDDIIIVGVDMSDFLDGSF